MFPACGYPCLLYTSGSIVLAYDKQGRPVTTEDLEVAGAMTAWMRNTINPTLCYTVEHLSLIHISPSSGGSLPSVRHLTHHPYTELLTVYTHSRGNERKIIPQDIDPTVDYIPQDDV